REFPRRAEELGLRGDAAFAKGLAVVGRELRLVIERIDVRRRPFHAQEDHALGAGRNVRRLRRERVILLGGPGRKPRERQIPETGRRGLEKEPARRLRILGMHGCDSHGSYGAYMSYDSQFRNKNSALAKSDWPNAAHAVRCFSGCRLSEFSYLAM